MDRAAHFDAFYREHCGAVRSFVHRRTPSAGADDAVAEVFVIAWRRLDSAPDDALPWLFGIARGVLANRRRGEARQRALRGRLAATAVVGVGDGPERLADEGPATRALRSLSRLDQEILLLVAWDGLDRAQAASVLGITTGLFSVRLHRARRRLKRALAGQDQASEQRVGDPAAVEVWR